MYLESERVTFASSEIQDMVANTCKRLTRIQSQVGGRIENGGLKEKREGDVRNVPTKRYAEKESNGIVVSLRGGVFG